MAQCRRVHLVTLDPRFPSSSFASDARRADTCPDRPAGADTVRLVLDLFEPDEQSFPEFNYGDLMDRQGTGAEGEAPVSRLEEGAEEDEAAALARRPEEKHGNKARKIDRIRDLIDIGYGYDEDDSFIDNSEPYDEFVPASLTTKFGGFYVNSGTLHFRLTSDPEGSSHPKPPEPTKKRKRNPGQEKPKKKACREVGGAKTDEDPRASAPKKKPVSTLSITNLLKKLQKEKEKEAATPPLCPGDAGGGSGMADPLLCLIGSTNDHALIQAASAVDFDIDLDSLLEASEATAGTQPAADPQPDTDGLTQAPPPDAHLQPKPPFDHSGVTFPNQCVGLPDGAPPRLAAAVEKLAAAAKTSEGESKLKFFTPEINSILLDIELQCREHGGQLRSKVYTHLSSFLPCSRDTVLKRVKKLLLAHRTEPPDAEDPLNKLKEAIGSAMPEQIAHFHETRRASQQPRPCKAAEEDDDVPRKLHPGAEDNLEERGWKKASPKKTFRWTEEIRELLSQVLTAKLEKNKEKGSQELEEVLKTLLDNEVKPLWPKGWMQSRVLMRESRKVLGLLPPLHVKKVRAEKKQPGGPAPPGDDRGVLKRPPLMKEAPKRPDGGTEVAPAGSPAPAEPAERPLIASAPRPSPLNLLADRAPAPPQLASQELLAAAIAKYKHSVRSWSFALDTKSPPLPPPPPQSSPVEFPARGAYHLLPLGDFARHMDAGQPTDGADATIQ